MILYLLLGPVFCNFVVTEWVHSFGLMRPDNGVYVQIFRWLAVKECTYCYKGIFSCTVVRKFKHVHVLQTPVTTANPAPLSHAIRIYCFENTMAFFMHHFKSILNISLWRNQHLFLPVIVKAKYHCQCLDKLISFDSHLGPVHLLYKYFPGQIFIYCCLGFIPLISCLGSMLHVKD